MAVAVVAAAVSSSDVFEEIFLTKYKKGAKDPASRLDISGTFVNFYTL